MPSLIIWHFCLQLSTAFGISWEEKETWKIYCDVSFRRQEKRHFKDFSLSNKNVFDFYFLLIATYKRNGG